jgi:hypothetical protein
VGKRTKKYQDFVIDKLTNSIENTLSGEVFDTEIVQVMDKDIKSFKRKDWNFDWKSEFKDKSKQIFKPTTTNNSTIILGLLSIEDKNDHIFMHLVNRWVRRRARRQGPKPLSASLMPPLNTQNESKKKSSI